MYDNVFAPDVQQRTEKCLVAVDEKGSASCESCGKPASYIVRGHCTRCAIDKGIKLLSPNNSVLNQAS